MKRKQNQRAHTSAKVRVSQWINVGLILFMFSIVIYDSFVHNLPFYYILFILAGLLIGQLERSSVTQKTARLTVKSRTIGNNRFIDPSIHKIYWREDNTGGI